MDHYFALIIGAIFILLTLILGKHILPLFNLIPMAILGVLLLFAGSQLALSDGEGAVTLDFACQRCHARRLAGS